MEITQSWEELGDEFAELGAQVAAELNERSTEDERGWTHEHEVNAYGSVTLTHPAGWAVHIFREKPHLKEAAGRRLTICGVVAGEYRGGAQHRITVGGDRTPKGIADDITRRLLPNYRAAARAAAAQRDEDAANARARARLHEQMRAVLPALRSRAGGREDHRYGSFYKGGTMRQPERAHASGMVRISASGSSVDIELDGVPAALTLEILALLNVAPQPLTGRVMPREVAPAPRELAPAVRTIPGVAVGTPSTLGPSPRSTREIDQLGKHA